MIENIKVLPFPDFVLNKLCDISWKKEIMSEEGEQDSILIKKVPCFFSEKTKHILTPDGKRIDLVGKIILKGDVAPNIAKISGGIVEIYDKGNVNLKKKVQIYSCSRPCNLDGSVHHTTLEVM